jgi:hypothetical protein
MRIRIQALVLPFYALLLSVEAPSNYFKPIILLVLAFFPVSKGLSQEREWSFVDING